MRCIAELALSISIARRKPSRRARETFRRIAIATILGERSLFLPFTQNWSKTCQADRYSARRGQNRGPTLIAHRNWLLKKLAALAWRREKSRAFSPRISNAWFQTVLSIGRFTEDQRKACGQLTTTARRQRAKSRGNAQVARTRARHASRAARRKDTQKVRETFTRAPVPTPHPSRLHGPRPS